MSKSALRAFALATVLLTAADDVADPVTPGHGNAPQQASETTWRTDHFAVTAPSRKLARNVGRAAERHLRRLSLLWTGTASTSWDQRCVLRVTLTGGDEYSNSVLGFMDGKVVIHEIHLRGSLREVWAELPCQITHVILAHHFGRPMPRWAESGAAELCRHGRVRRQDRRWLYDNLDGERLVRLRPLLPDHDYPHDVTAMYAEGVSLTEYLIRLGGRSRYLAFVAQGEQDGWDRAANSRYHFATVDELEAAWLAFVRRERNRRRD